MKLFYVQKKGGKNAAFYSNGNFYKGRDQIIVTPHPSESHPILLTRKGLGPGASKRANSFTR
jgi:hypothetical protein